MLEGGRESTVVSMVNRITRRDFLVGADEVTNDRAPIEVFNVINLSMCLLKKLLVCIPFPFPLEYHHTHIGLRITYYLSKIIILFGNGELWQKISCSGEILIGVNKFESSPRVTTIMSALFQE